MGHLFLDIESYLQKGHEESGKNPYLPESKVILISYNYYSTKNPPVKDEIKPPTFLKEWESSEKNILVQFMKFLEELRRKDAELKVHGFNILKFDLPYLFGRMKHHRLGNEKELHDLLFGQQSTDMMQLSEIISDSTRKKEGLWDIQKHDLNRFFDIQTEEWASEECSRYYDEKKYDNIIDYCKKEFSFEQLLNSFYLYVERLMEGKIE